jgi:hypothetical protein
MGTQTGPGVFWWDTFDTLFDPSSLISYPGSGLILYNPLKYSGFSEDKVISTEVITNFNHEYGFIFKRLPVIKVSYQGDNQLRHFIEPSTGELAAKMTQLDSIEGLSFALIHKWNFNGLNKNLRDILVSLFALGNLIVAMLGLKMFLKLK